MKDKKSSITVNGIDYPVIFNLNVMEAIQEEFGTLRAWGELTDGEDGEPNVGAVISGFMHMINEGIDIENAERKEHRVPLERKEVGRIITEIGFSEAAKILNKTVVESTDDGESGKN